MSSQQNEETMTDDKRAVVKVPDGKGGWVTVEPGTKANLDKDKTTAAVEAAAKKDFFDRVGAATEALNKFMAVYVKDYGLKPLEAAAAIYLENCNNRHFFPEDLGGKETFDRMTSEIWDWFVTQVKTK
jgi:hypothetical protein